MKPQAASFVGSNPGACKDGARSIGSNTRWADCHQGARHGTGHGTAPKIPGADLKKQPIGIQNLPAMANPSCPWVDCPVVDHPHTHRSKTMPCFQPRSHDNGATPSPHPTGMAARPPQLSLLCTRDSPTAPVGSGAQRGRRVSSLRGRGAGAGWGHKHWRPSAQRELGHPMATADRQPSAENNSSSQPDLFVAQRPPP